MFGANNSITTYRKVNTGNTAAFSGSATVTGAEAYIENVSGDLAVVLGNNPEYEVFMCHVEPGDYILGDKVVDEQSNEYRIARIEKHENNEDTDDVYTMTINKKTTRHA